MLIAIILILAMILLILCWIICTVNSFRKKEMKVAESYSGVEVALTKRYDVLTKLLDAAEGFLQQERSVFLQTVQIRRNMSPEEIQNTEDRMDAVSEQILVAAENNPELQSKDVFQQLQYGIKDTEAQLASARRIYNSNARIYNTAIASFPASLLAGKRSPAPFFQEKSGVYQDLKFTF